MHPEEAISLVRKAAERLKVDLTSARIKEDDLTHQSIIAALVLIVAAQTELIAKLDRMAGIQSVNYGGHGFG